MVGSIVTDTGHSMIVFEECYCSVVLISGILDGCTQLTVDDNRRDKIPVGVSFYRRSVTLPPLG